MKKIYIGTSGWSYKHWQESFYLDLKSPQWLNHYGTIFSTVEINSTFYHTPSISTIQNWHAQVPSNFVFSIKASRYITHRKKLHDCEESIHFFYERIKHFKDKVGPILFQLPPSFKMDKDVLVEFISHLNPKNQHTFEFRHPSWFTPEIYDLLSKNQMGLCITDLNGTLSPQEITSFFTYIRLHGPKEAYSGSYSASELKAWEKKIEKWMSEVSVYCYFDNDEKGYAVQDAITLKKLLE